METWLKIANENFLFSLIQKQQQFMCCACIIKNSMPLGFMQKYGARCKFLQNNQHLIDDVVKLDVMSAAFTV